MAPARRSRQLVSYLSIILSRRELKLNAEEKPFGKILRKRRNVCEEEYQPRVSNVSKETGKGIGRQGKDQSPANFHGLTRLANVANICQLVVAHDPLADV